MLNEDFIREHVLRYITLGCSEEEAFLLSGFTDDEIGRLKNSPEYKKLVDIYLARETAKLLSAHRKAALLSAKKGSTAGLQWKLSKLHPKRFGNDDSASGKESSSPLTIHIQTMTKEDLENMSGIEIYKEEE